MKFIKIIVLLFIILACGGISFLIYKEKTTFKPLFKNGEEVIVYTKKPPIGNVTVKDDTTLSSVVQFFKGKVEKSPSNPGETYKVKILKVYGATGIKEDEVYEYDKSMIFKLQSEAKLIANLSNNIKKTRYEMAYEKVQRLIDNVQKNQLTLQDPNNIVKEEIERFKAKTYLSHDILKLVKVKKLIASILDDLENIFKLNEAYYNDFNSNIVDLEKMIDLEMTIHKVPFGITHKSFNRILYYLSFSGSTPDINNEYIRSFISRGANPKRKYFEGKEYDDSFEMLDGGNIGFKGYIDDYKLSLQKARKELKVAKEKEKIYLDIKSSYDYITEFHNFFEKKKRDLGLEKVASSKLNFSNEQMKQIKKEHASYVIKIAEKMNQAKADFDKMMLKTKRHYKSVQQNCNKLRFNHFYGYDYYFDYIEAMFYLNGVEGAHRWLRSLLIYHIKPNIKDYLNTEWFEAIKEWSLSEYNSYRYVAMEDGFDFDVTMYDEANQDNKE